MNPQSSRQTDRSTQPLPEAHLESIHRLESAYLCNQDPILQSGFGGGPDRWRAERSPLLDAVDGDGEFLDLGCANGFLLESVLEWADERGISLKPYGVDLNALLIPRSDTSISRIRGIISGLEMLGVGCRQGVSRWVYAIWDLVPIEMMPTLARQLLQNAVRNDGAVIFGAYGSKSADTPPVDIARALIAGGLPVSGESAGGELSSGGPVTKFAWIRRRDWLADPGCSP